MSISIISACKNRNQALQISLNSWLNFKEIKEIIIVDWSSDEPLDYLSDLDERIKIITVSDKDYFNQPQPLNLALSVATGDYILKLDSDHVINPYYNFFDTYNIDKNSFVSGKPSCDNYEVYSEEMETYVIDHTKMSYEQLSKYFNSYSPYYKYLTGLLFTAKENLIKIGGYNENLGKYYAFEDDELYQRLELLGLNHVKMNYDHTCFHIPHPDKKRIENFEGYADKEYNQIVRDNLSPYYSGQELEWQIEYALSVNHIKKNEEIISKIENYYVKPKTKWTISQIEDGKYSAKMINQHEDEKKIEVENKLSNFPSVHYVTLEESIDRRISLHDQFESYGVTNITPLISKRYHEDDNAPHVYGEQLHILDGGTIGCTISHIKAIRNWYETTDEDYALFCEDDLSLETVKYWNFTWEEFIETLPEDSECVQLCAIRSTQKEIKFRERTMYDWCVTAYILTRDYARKIIERYCDGDSYRLEIPGTNFYPMPETVLFYGLGKVYSIDLFVEDQNLKSTFTEIANIEGGNKEHHIESYEYTLRWWKENGANYTIRKLFGKSEIIHEKTELETLLSIFGSDTENPRKNYDVGLWYEGEGHTAPALTYFLRAAERSTEDNFTYECLLKCHHSYDRQGTRDGTAVSLLQQALCILPKRPEAYYLLARFHERRHQWSDCYKYSSMGLSLCEFDNPPLISNVEYPGNYGLLFEKAVSGWWWGKVDESKEILLDLAHNDDLDPNHYTSVVNNLKHFNIDITSEKKI